ncbi:P-loop containing nucleoside triphosphate hydrolase protein [Globomyces pollinis-pini]|nr:P-loop containing nucleoside triphosphate hydrolase protein [Globomyces pollinis-pini]
MQTGTTESEETLPWVEKYRPKELQDLVSHTDIISTIKTFMDQNKLPHLLFYGPPGTGKTSTILACARHLFGPKFKSMILELNASDDRGIAVVRDQIKSFASTKTLFSNNGYKMIILDEADALTQTAQNALRRVIEQYTKNVRFCLICNYVGKIIPALQSRCTRFRFAPLELPQIENRLKFVIDQEGVNIDDDAKKSLLKLANGDMRRALNILQAAHVAHDHIVEDTIYATTGSPLPSDIVQIVHWLMNAEFGEAYHNIRSLQIEKGLSVIDILTRVFNTTLTLDMPSRSRIYMLEQMADIEYSLSVGGSETLQLSALVGVFKVALEMTVVESNPQR